MKKAGDILAELGFREDAPQSLQEAFLRNLIRQTTGANVSPPARPKTETVCAPKEPVQLSFDFRPASSSKKVG